MKAALVGLFALMAFGVPLSADAWGADGHRIISGTAITALPTSMPAFVRNAARTIAVLGTEPDRLKGAGRAFDADEDPAHYLDLDDDGTVAGTVRLDALPPSREAYDTALRSGHPTNGQPSTEYRVGYVPYAMLDGYEIIAKDFAIWRVDVYAQAHAASAADREFFSRDRAIRELLAVRDIGFWSHFIGDASQPLHISVHFNGWTGPNPEGYTTAHTIHAKFETTFVHQTISAGAVAARIAPYAAPAAPFASRMITYLQASNAQVPRVYALEKAGAFDAARPEAVAFTLDRLAAGATMLRDSIVEAYTASAELTVGYPGVRVRDVESGSVAITRTTFGE